MKNLPKLKMFLDDKAKPYPPLRANSTDAGIDLRTPKAFYIYPKCYEVVKTGVHIAIPEGYAGFVKSKSGLHCNRGLLTTGVIDPGYSGEIVVRLFNSGEYVTGFEPGDKIAQLVITPVLTPAFENATLEEVEEEALKASDRGSNGFGSTGR